MAQKQYLYVTIPTNAASPNAAILYGVFFSTPEGQAWIRNRYEGDLDSYPESTQRGRIADLEKSGVKFATPNIDWAAKNRQIEAQLIALIKLIQRK